MKQIDAWITKLDMEEPVSSEYEIVQLMYADPSEVQSSIEGGFRDLPGTEFLPNILIQPLQQTRQVVVFGRQDLRDIVKTMIAEIDIPPGQFETRHFRLKYADPDQIKTSIEELFAADTLPCTTMVVVAPEGQLPHRLIRLKLYRTSRSNK
jgi:hypothetical protein